MNRQHWCRQFKQKMILPCGKNINLKSNQTIRAARLNGIGFAKKSLRLFWIATMRHYQLTPRLSLTLNACRPGLKIFSGKTNRLALYSLCLCGLEMNLYVARHWAYNIWEDALAFIEPASASIARSAAPAQPGIVPFRSSRRRPLRLLPPARNKH